MNRTNKRIIITILVIAGLIGILYYGLLQIDFIGYKDPKIMEENRQRWDKMLLSAEYRKGADYCEIKILDSTNIEINIGDSAGGIILTEKYNLHGDTIVVLGGIKHANKYMNSDRLVIYGNKILYLLDSLGRFDTTQTLNVKFNNIKL